MTKLDEFLETLPTRSRALLMLDYDGTLAPFRANRLEATPAPGIRERLEAILACPHTRLVFVTGRPCEELMTVSGLRGACEIWGCHGREYRGLDGVVRLHGVTSEEQAVLAGEYRKAQRILPDFAVELKTGCLAFHWRGVEEQERTGLLEIMEPRWREISARTGLDLHLFDGGIELSVPGRSKGDAVNALLAEHEGEEIAAAFLGDDNTDENGFRALGERGLSVLVRNEERATEADIRVSMPDGVIDFLDRWLKATQKGARP